MNARTRERPDEAPQADTQALLPLAEIGARVANIVMTAQVQVAYACAAEAGARARRAGACIERSWPNTPLRELVLNAYRAQEHSADVVARGVLAGARRRCGLAFAQY